MNIWVFTLGIYVVYSISLMIAVSLYSTALIKISNWIALLKNFLVILIFLILACVLIVPFTFLNFPQIGVEFEENQYFMIFFMVSYITSVLSSVILFTKKYLPILKMKGYYKSNKSNRSFKNKL